jgi:hypothetical protein
LNDLAVTRFKANRDELSRQLITTRKVLLWKDFVSHRKSMFAGPTPMENYYLELETRRRPL